MGRVFSIEEVKAGLVPEKADFEAALAGFSEAVGEELKYGTIDGAVVYGLVALGSYSRRSDLDCVIIPERHTYASIAAIRRIKRAAKQDGKV